MISKIEKNISIRGANVAEHIKKKNKKALFPGIFHNDLGKSHQLIKIYKNVSFRYEM